MSEKDLTVDLFDTFCGYVKECADGRGDPDSAFHVWVDNSMMDTLRNTRRLLDQLPQWISVDDQLPEKDVTVLAVKQLKDGRRDLCLARCIPDWEYTEYPSGEKKRKPYWVTGGNNNILFWMPLPEIPKEA